MNRVLFNSLYNFNTNNYLLKAGSCSNGTDFKIGGNYFSSEYNWINIQILTWKGKTIWKSTTEINKAIKTLSIGVGIMEYFFDSNDYVSPVKLNININQLYGLMPSFKKAAIVKLQK